MKEPILPYFVLIASILAFTASSELSVRVTVLLWLIAVQFGILITTFLPSLLNFWITSCVRLVPSFVTQ